LTCSASTCGIDCSGSQSCPKSVCCWAGQCTLQPSTLACKH
jgi:hypothetical protein